MNNISHNTLIDNDLRFVFYYSLFVNFLQNYSLQIWKIVLPLHLIFLS